MSEQFKEIGVGTSIINGLAKQNITVPTDIQKKVIPLAMQNVDIIAQSETGTGKTLAYLISLYEKIDIEAKQMQVIIITPTHELALQIKRQIETLTLNSGNAVTSTVIIGNVNIARQIEKLKEKPHIVIGSPGRILELIKKRKIPAHLIKTIILDEADRLLDENNAKTVVDIIKSTMRDRQLMMFSATISKKVIAKAKDLMKEPEIIKSEEKLSVPDTIEHYYFASEQRDKVEVLRKLVRLINPNRALAFLNRSEEIDFLTTKLKYHGIKAETIHGANRKLERKQAIDHFKTGKLQLLVASDIAARGLDIEGITHIFNLDFPENPIDYLHRVGRTGRAGNKGIAISIITERELPIIKSYEKALQINITPKDMYKGKIVDK